MGLWLNKLIARWPFPLKPGFVPFPEECLSLDVAASNPPCLDSHLIPAQSMISTLSLCGAKYAERKPPVHSGHLKLKPCWESFKTSFTECISLCWVVPVTSNQTSTNRVLVGYAYWGFPGIPSKILGAFFTLIRNAA